MPEPTLKELLEDGATIEATVKTYYTLVDGEWQEQFQLGKEIAYYTSDDEDVSPSMGFPAHPDDGYDHEQGGWQDIVPDQVPEHRKALEAGTWVDDTDWCRLCHAAGLRHRHAKCHAPGVGIA
jgi:hypothetical protein